MVLLTLLLLLGTFSVTQAATFLPGSSATTTAALNFRAGPSLNDTVLQVLPPGAQLSIQNGPYNAAWYHARYGDRLGYVHGAYLTATSASSNAPTLVGAGDIMDCGLQSDEATAALLDRLPGTVFTLGDHVHPIASAHAFAQCYDPSWGRHKARTRPAPGNHDYAIPGAADYFDYFGAAAGDPSKGYYSYDLGTWHIIVLNSACNAVGCEAGSPQEQWLRADLQAHPTTCTLAYWHHPLFSSRYGTDSRSQPLWQALYDAGAEVVLNGHAHTYERFAPQTPHGQRDDARGIRAFVVGTGGAPLRPFATNQPHSEVLNNSTHGVLKLTLHATSYDWQFVPVVGQTFTDAGSTACH
jgi:hypothetical protein